MLQNDFITHMGRLEKRETWAKKFDDDFKKILWKKIKHFHVFNLEITVDAFLSQHKCPNVDDIFWLMDENAKRLDKSSAMTQNDCQWCDGFGIVMMDSPVGKRQCPFQCTHCDNGAMIKKLTANFSDGSIATARQGWQIGWRPANSKILKLCNAAMASKKTTQPVTTFFQDSHY